MSQRRADAQAKAKAAKDAAAAAAAAATGRRDANSRPSSQGQEDVASGVAKQTVEAGSIKHTPTANKEPKERTNDSVKSRESSSPEKTAPHWTTTSPTAAPAATTASTDVVASLPTAAAVPTAHMSDPSPPPPPPPPVLSVSERVAAQPLTSVVIQFGDVPIEIQSDDTIEPDRRTVAPSVPGKMPTSTRPPAVVMDPSKRDKREAAIVALPTEPAPAAGAASAATSIPSANISNMTSRPMPTASSTAPSPTESTPASNRIASNPAQENGGNGGTADRSTQSKPDSKGNAGGGGSPQASAGAVQHTADRPPATKGLLSSPSLAGSIPAPHVSAAWKPLPVGIAATAFGMASQSVDGDDNAASAAAATAAAAAAPNVGRSGGVEAWAASPQATMARAGGPSFAGVSGQHHGEMLPPQQLNAAQAEWMQGRGGRGNVGPGPGAQAQRGNFGPASAPAAPGNTGWNPAQALASQHQAGGIVGMVGANGGGSSVGGRLRSAPEGFAVGVGGGNPSMLQPPLPPRPASMVRSSSGGRHGSPGGSHGHRSNDSIPSSGIPAPLAGGVGGGVSGGAFGGFMLGYQSPGTRQQLMQGGANWGGAGFPQSVGSPGAAVAGIAGGLTSPGARQQQQQQQQQSPQQQAQQRQALYTSFATGVAPGMASSAPNTMATTLPTSSGPTTVAVPAGAAGVPGGDNVNAPNSVLAAEAPPFIPAGNMGVGSPAMWGMAGPPLPAPAGLNGQPPLPAAVMLPPVSQGLGFGTGGGVAMGVRVRQVLGPMAGVVAVPGAGMAPANVNVNVRGGMIASSPSPAMIATQQMQQQMHHQQQMHQQQVRKVPSSLDACS